MGASHHRKPTIVSTSSPQALTVTPTRIILHPDFVVAVMEVYSRRNMGCMQPRQVLSAVRAALEAYPGRLPEWNDAAIDAALGYLANTGKIVFTERLPHHVA